LLFIALNQCFIGVGILRNQRSGTDDPWRILKPSPKPNPNQFE